MNANRRECGEDLLLKDEVYRIAGTAMEVSNTLGCGFLEAVYQEALGIEFSEANVPFGVQESKSSEVQIIHYLRATELPVGLVLNFGGKKMEWKRYACTMQ